jgi:hypothetical protein
LNINKTTKDNLLQKKTFIEINGVTDDPQKKTDLVFNLLANILDMSDELKSLADAIRKANKISAKDLKAFRDQADEHDEPAVSLQA